ncbi:hypothetical protein GS426_05810 [Rhodococcus hoagii]|nr:hypothetical protein [Prescottella equi]
MVRISAANPTAALTDGVAGNGSTSESWSRSTAPSARSSPEIPKAGLMYADAARATATWMSSRNSPIGRPTYSSMSFSSYDAPAGSPRSRQPVPFLGEVVELDHSVGDPRIRGGTSQVSAILIAPGASGVATGISCSAVRARCRSSCTACSRWARNHPPDGAPCCAFSAASSASWRAASAA